jgi:spore maturation protein CgeB
VRRGWQIEFYEKDVPYYAAHRDLTSLPGMDLILYKDFEEIAARATRSTDEAQVAMVTSYCPDGIAASQLVLESSAEIRAFYDLDTPVTLARLGRGETVDYLPPHGLGEFDLVLSYTGGGALEGLRQVLGARNVAPLYGSVDPHHHFPVPPNPAYLSDFSYLGTYAEDRQVVLNELFIKPAGKVPSMKFLIGGSQYPKSFPWSNNIYFMQHVPPPEHPAFFCSSKMTLNVTRKAMADSGYCPSGRLFEAAACGVPLVSDWWEGLDTFFTPGKEIILAKTCEDTLAALSLTDQELRTIARAARERTLAEHTAHARTLDLERILEATFRGDLEAPVKSERI